MIPQLLWMMALALAAALSWRALTQGGPWADWIWQGLGLAGLAVFGGEIFAAGPVLMAAIAREDVGLPLPVLQWHVATVAVLMLLRPSPRAVSRERSGEVRR
jgi:hypothetical protein